MASRPEPSREKLSWDDESGGVGPEVGEEEGERVQDDKPDVVAGLEMVVRDGQREHEHRHEEESLELDDPPADMVNEGNSHPIPRHGGAERNQGLRPGDPVNLSHSVHRRGGRDPPNSRENILLEQVLGVESCTPTRSIKSVSYEASSHERKRAITEAL